MEILHFDVSKESVRRLDSLFSSYGRSNTICIDMRATTLFLTMIEKGDITVTKESYQYDHEIDLHDPDIRKIYQQVAWGTRWRSGTSIQWTRMNALHQLKSYGTPISSDGRYILYEDSHVCAHVGNEEIYQLMTYLCMHKDIEKWILFPNPTYNKNAYYIFDITPKALDCFQKYVRMVSHEVVEALESVSRIYMEESEKKN